MESIDKTTLVWIITFCVTIITGLITYIFARQGKDIKRNGLMLLAHQELLQKQALQLEKQGGALVAIKALFKQSSDSTMALLDQITKAIPREVKLELAEIKEGKK